MARYANTTEVTVSKSKAEIEDTLHRYKASGFMSGWHEGKAMIAFQIKERHVRFILPMPNRMDKEFTHSPTGKARTTDAAYNAWEQGCRQRWRALALAIKAKLEAVECGIVTFDQEFLAHIVAHNGRTVGEQIIPLIEAKKTPRLCLE
jgi:hypothetical protein